MESCRNFSEFYCNTCHLRICDQCNQHHLEQNNGHEIVLYHERRRKIPAEKCRIHPTKDINVYCDECQDSVCSICFAWGHRDHNKVDLEAIYNIILTQCQSEISKIWKTVIPEAKNNVQSIGEKRENVKKEIAKFRVSMKERADELKEAVESILTDNLKKLDEIENYVLNEIAEQQKETEDYIKYLEKIISEYESKISSIKHTKLMKFQLEILLASLKMHKKPKLPIFTLATLNKEEISKQFGEIKLDSPKRLKISCVIKVSEIAIQEHGTSHLSPLAPNKFWASERWENLIQYDMEGNILHKISTSMNYIPGNHTVTKEGELLYTVYNKNTVYRVTSDNTISKLIKTGSWTPGAIYSSPINGHILVGMKRNSDQKITRYNREGRKLQDIQRDDIDKSSYQSIRYLTENINGNICVSDSYAGEVVVVTASGQYHFSYSGHQSQSEFFPCGICTDVLGHIVVCNGSTTNYSSVHLLDINGQFLSLLLTPEQCPPHPRALCIDDKHNLWIGGSNEFTVFVYKYLQNTKP